MDRKRFFSLFILFIFLISFVSAFSVGDFFKGIYCGVFDCEYDQNEGILLAPNCTNECDPLVDKSKCGGNDTKYQTCKSHWDADTCYEWGPSTGIDCPLGYICDSGSTSDTVNCVLKCISNQDCSPGQICNKVTGRCEEDPNVCDLPCGTGEVCIDGNCVPDSCSVPLGNSLNVSFSLPISGEGGVLFSSLPLDDPNFCKCSADGTSCRTSTMFGDGKPGFCSDGKCLEDTCDNLYGSEKVDCSSVFGFPSCCPKGTFCCPPKNSGSQFCCDKEEGVPEENICKAYKAEDAVGAIDVTRYACDVQNCPEKRCEGTGPQAKSACCSFEDTCLVYKYPRGNPDNAPTTALCGKPDASSCGAGFSECPTGGISTVSGGVLCCNDEFETCTPDPYGFDFYSCMAKDVPNPGFQRCQGAGDSEHVFLWCKLGVEVCSRHPNGFPFCYAKSNPVGSFSQQTSTSIYLIRNSSVNPINLGGFAYLVEPKINFSVPITVNVSNNDFAKEVYRYPDHKSVLNLCNVTEILNISKTVGVEGGIIDFNGEFILDVPPGALVENRTIRVTSINLANCSKLKSSGDACSIPFFFSLLSKTNSSYFDGNSTNLSSVNLSNFSLVLEKAEYGVIEFNHNVSVYNYLGNLADYINISQNHIEINSSFLPELNVSATLTLRNLSFNNPRILIDSQVCDEFTCKIQSYVNGTLVFNVSHFTSYSVEETLTSNEGSSGNSGGGGGSGRRTSFPLGEQENITSFPEPTLFEKFKAESCSEIGMCDIENKRYCYESKNWLIGSYCDFCREEDILTCNIESIKNSCGNNKCEKFYDESFYSCFNDCKDESYLLVLVFVLVVCVGLIGYFVSKSSKKKGKRKA